MRPLLLLLALALAGDDAGTHAAVAPRALAVAATDVPPGPPRTLTVTPGADLQAVVRTLPAGSTLVLGAGVHRGRIVVDRPMTLRGEAGAVIDGGGTGSVVVVVAHDVVVSDLRVTGGGTLPQEDDAGVVVQADRFRVERVVVDHVYLGIDLRRAHDGVVRGCTVSGDPDGSYSKRGDGIRLWEAHRDVVEGNTLQGVRDLVLWYSDDVVVRDNVVRGSRYGTHLMHASGAHVERNRYEDDVVGVFVMYSDDVRVRGNRVQGALGPAGLGLGFKESDRVHVADNDLVGNTTGLYLDNTPHALRGEARFEGNLVAANDVGLRFHGAEHGPVFARNLVSGNRLDATVDGGGDASGSTFVGNTWGGYAGYDLDRDGVGDLPFELRSLSGSLVDHHPDVAFLTGSPAAALLDLFAAAFPMWAPKPLLRDEAPRLSWRRS
jgi:nitrous oxidase accessory protein